MIRMIHTIISRDIRLAYARMAIVIGVVSFFVITASMFLFAVAQLELIPQIAPGIIWVCALLASLLALDGIYKDDWDNGVLEQLLLQGHGAVPVILAKILAHWCVTGVPILITSPLVMLMLGGAVEECLPLIGGTIALSMMTTMGAALTVGSHRANLVMGIVILPLYIPIMIFGVHHDYTLLFGIILFIFPACVVASRYALTMAIDT